MKREGTLRRKFLKLLPFFIILVFLILLAFFLRGNEPLLAPDSGLYDPSATNPIICTGEKTAYLTETTTITKIYNYNYKTFTEQDGGPFAHNEECSSYIENLQTYILNCDPNNLNPSQYIGMPYELDPTTINIIRFSSSTSLTHNPHNACETQTTYSSDDWVISNTESRTNYPCNVPAGVPAQFQNFIITDGVYKGYEASQCSYKTSRRVGDTRITTRVSETFLIERIYKKEICPQPFSNCYFSLGVLNDELPAVRSFWKIKETKTDSTATEFKCAGCLF